MSWVTIIWSMVASACLTMAAMHLLIWCKKRTAWASLLFSLTAVATAAMAFYELRMMGAETPGQFGTALRWVHVPAFALIVGLVGFVQIHLRAGRRWLAWTTCAVRAFSLLLNFLMEPNVNYREVTRLRHIPFLGDSVSVCEGVPSPWNIVGHLSLLLLVIFVSDAGITVWRRGDRRQAVVVGGSIVFFVLGATVQTMLARWEVFHWPQTSSLFFLVIVAAMAYELTREVLTAAQLSDDLREHEQRLDLAADSAGVGLWSWDFKTNFIWATERARMLYGFSLDEPIPFEKFLSKLHPDDLDWVVQASQKCLQEGVDFRHDYRIVSPDGGIRWFKVLAKAFLEPSGEPERITGVSLDITERKQAELELQQKRHELAHLSRVNMLGELASSLAHELNQPLGAILRNAEAAELFLQAPSPDLDEVRAILADIRKDDQRAAAVIDRMRPLLKGREVEHSLLDLNLLAGEVINLVRPEADSRKIRLALNPVSSLPPVRGDLVQLQQVLLNLLLNAMDAVNDSAPDGRRVTTVRVQASGTQVEVAVSDTGHGLPEDELLRVFEPFFTSKPNGLGMGLAISHSIIKAHGGRLWAENNTTGGATFTFTLPAAEGGNKK
jgi:two-component system, LuxR family, sensor kinase FixL